MVKLGMIGMSPGNAHPYSWSSIINGAFNGNEISKAGYPHVSEYLAFNRDHLGLEDARVTHIWTQDKIISQSIARSAHVEKVVSHLAEMVSQVDAVILARDDADAHVAMSAPFIDAGIPIFIDKPLATNRKDLAWFAKQESQGNLIMSCSSMRYSEECRRAKMTLESLGVIELVTAVGKKDWEKYGVHLLEAIFYLLDDPKPGMVQYSGEQDRDIVQVRLQNGIRISLHLFKDIVSTFQLSIFGEKGWQLVEIKNSFAMFRNNLLEFISSVKLGESQLTFDKTENIIHTLIGARESQAQQGRVVQIMK